MKKIIDNSIKVGLITILLLLGTKVHLFSQTNMWIGGVADWNVAGNWSLGHVPTNQDTVIIGAGQEVTIPTSFNAVSNHMYIDGKLINKGSLNFPDSLYGFSTMTVKGEVDNIGQIMFSDHHYGCINLRSTGSFINSNSGQINIDSKGNTAIFGGDTSQFINHGSIEANDLYSILFWLEDRAILENYGLIRQASPGIFNTGAIISHFSLFENKPTGHVEFGGIMLMSQQPMMNNRGDLYTSSVTISDGEFNNVSPNQNDPAQLFVIKLEVEAEFSNDGKVMIQPDTNFPNLTPGLVFNSQATIFQNSLCGVMEVDGIISILYPSHITNDGIIIQDYNGMNLVNTLAYFNNDGIIIDIYNSFGGLYNGNNGYALRKITSMVTRGIPLQQAILGNGNGLSITNNQFYIDKNRTISAGTFSTINNTWNPTLAAIGKDTFYMEVINSNCAINGIITLENPVQVDCGDIGFISASGDWDDPNNWDKARLPTECDTVNIPLNTSVTIPSGFSAASASINNSGILNLDAGSMLIMSDTAQIDLIYNRGTIVNNGEIYLSHADVGIFNTINSNLINNNRIEITNINNSGLRCGGSVSNAGTIKIDGGFYGVIGDELNTFSNYGNILIENTTYNGLYLRNEFLFRNENMGTLEVAGINSTGIEVDGNSTSMINYGNLEIDSTGYVGLMLTNHSSFRNYAGSFSITRTKVSGILIDDQNTILENDAHLLIDPDDQKFAIQIIDTSQLVNNHCGTIDVREGIFMYNAAMINHGHLKQSEVTSYNSWFNSITNNGVIEDPEDNFAGHPVINNGYLIGLLSGTFTENVPAPNIMQGMGNQLNIVNNTLYTDYQATNGAGIYDPLQNIWTPNTNAVGSSQFFVVVDYNSLCQDTVEINLSSPVQPACIGFSNSWIGGPIGDWDVSSNWDQGHIPLSCEDIFIPSGSSVTIPFGVYAVGRSILIEGNLINNQGLTLSGAIERPGMDIFRGEVENNGSIYIHNVQGGNGNCHGIRTYGPGARFINLYSSFISINMVSDYGILQESGSRIEADGLIEILNTGQDEMFTDLGGEIDGNGQVVLNGGNWINEGEVGHSFFINELNIEGDLILNSTSLINLQLNNSNGGGYIFDNDLIETQGDLMLSGDLQLLLIDGYIPPEGEVYEIMKYTGTLSGAFSQVIFPSPEMDGWQIDYGIQEPGSILLYKPMVNDLCNNAIDLIQTSPMAEYYIAHTYQATDADHPGICNVDFGTAPGIWYKLTVSNFLDYSIVTYDPNFNVRVGLFSGFCGSINCIKGLDNSVQLSYQEIESINPGGITTDIYIYYSGFNADVGRFNFSIQSSIPPCIPNGNMWIGGGSNAWNDASQWSLGHIPLRCENVIIPSGPPVTIPAGYTAYASSIYLQGYLLNNGGMLTVSGADQQPGIENDGGHLENYGTIEIINITGMNGRGLEAGSTSMVTNQGTIRTINVVGHDLHIRNGCIFNNNGTIDIKD